jgi:DNA polymerase III alpha subunit
LFIDTKTYYSFCFGTFSTSELIASAVEQGMTVLALCNINSTYDHWEFVKLCHEANIKPVLGVDIRNNHQHCYLLIAKNNSGLQWLNEFLSNHLINKQDFPIDPIAPEDVFVIYPNESKSVAELKPNERICIKPYELSSLYNFTPTEYHVIHQPVVVQDKEHFYLHCLLRAIDQNILLSQLDPNTCCNREDTFVSPSKLLAQCQRYPTLVTNTYKLLDACSIDMDFHTDKTRQVFGDSKEDDAILLDKLARAGLVRRYGKRNKKVADRLDYKLRVNSELTFIK